MSRFVKDNFVDRRISTNLHLSRSKMAKPTYFLTSCAIGFGWLFHRLCEIYDPLTFFTNLHAAFFYAPLLFFSRNQILRVWNSFTDVSISTTYFHKIFAMKTAFSAF